MAVGLMLEDYKEQTSLKGAQLEAVFELLKDTIEGIVELFPGKPGLAVLFLNRAVGNSTFGLEAAPDAEAFLVSLDKLSGLSKLQTEILQNSLKQLHQAAAEKLDPVIVNGIHKFNPAVGEEIISQQIALLAKSMGRNTVKAIKAEADEVALRGEIYSYITLEPRLTADKAWRSGPATIVDLQVAEDSILAWQLQREEYGYVVWGRDSISSEETAVSPPPPPESPSESPSPPPIAINSSREERWANAAQIIPDMSDLPRLPSYLFDRNPVADDIDSDASSDRSFSWVGRVEGQHTARLQNGYAALPQDHINWPPEGQEAVQGRGSFIGRILRRLYLGNNTQRL